MIKKQITKLMAAVVVLSGTMAGAAAPEASTYKIDGMHSKVGFEISHLVISTVEGSFKEFSGEIKIDKDFSKSSLTAAAKIDSVDTGVADRDKHLKSADFFDSAKHPEMTFVSTSIKGKPESFKLEGDLTIRGTKKKVTFDAKYLGTVKDGYGQTKAAFNATAKIKRKDFGLNWSSMVEAGPVVGDEVTITLKMQATQQVAKVEEKKK